MRFQTTLAYYKDTLYSYCIVVPQEAVDTFVTADSRRVICTLNDTHTFQCAINPQGNGVFFIPINKTIRTKLKIDAGSPLTVVLEKDESEYGLPVPEEFSALMEMDDEASLYFESLTPGKKRNLLHLVNTHKTSDTRLKKAIVVVDHLKLTKGKLDFKLLYQMIKDANKKI